MQSITTYPQRRVVISGLGVVAPNGIGKESFWQACISGQSGIRPITRFDASTLPVRIAGEVVDFNPQQFGLTPGEITRLARDSQFALAAAHLALRDAELTLSVAERERTGIYVGTAMSCVEEGEQLWVAATQAGTQPLDSTHFHPDNTALMLSNASAFSIAAHYQLHGPATVISTGCSAGADAIGQAFWLIQEGRADRMLAGGCDSAISPISLDVFCIMNALSTHYNEEPHRASRPYDNERDGFVMAEGAAILLLEEREAALARGAHIYAEIMNFTSNCNAYHMTALPEDGMPLQQLCLQALSEASLSPAQIDYINSHGSSTPTNDAAETAAYKAAFGEHAYRIPISATKSLIGHSQGAASAIETIVTALALDRQVLPPTINQETPDPRCDLNYVPNVAQAATIHIALTHSSGFGGVSSALILAHPDWTEHYERA